MKQVISRRQEQGHSQPEQEQLALTATLPLQGHSEYQDSQPSMVVQLLLPTRHLLPMGSLPSPPMDQMILPLIQELVIQSYSTDCRRRVELHCVWMGRIT